MGHRDWFKLGLVLLIAGLGGVITKPVWAADYYVSTTGNDNNSGTQQLPFSSIQKAANTVQAGDRVRIMPGVYRETVNVRRSGSVGNPITFEAVNGWDTVFIYGSVNSKGFSWRSEGNGVYSADISQLPAKPELIYELQVPGSAFNGWPKYPEITFFQEIGDGIVKYPKAHEPDFTVETYWKYHENWATADGGNSVWNDNQARSGCPSSPASDLLACMSPKMTANSSLYNLTDQNTGGDGLDLRKYADLVGAVAYMMDTRSAFYIFRRQISSFDKSSGKIGWSDRADFDYLSGIPGIGAFTKYYLEGNPAFLDREMEWYINQNRLYIKTRTQVSPANLNIEIATRGIGLDFSEQSNLVFKGLDIMFVNNLLNNEGDIQNPEGALVGFHYSQQGEHVKFDHIKIAHSGKGITLRRPKVKDGLLSKDTQIVNSEIYDIEGNALVTYPYSLEGMTTSGFPMMQIVNNQIHHIGFKPVNRDYGLYFSNAYKLIIKDNYIHDVAHKCIAVTESLGEYILVKDNYLERCGLNHSEGSGFGIYSKDVPYTKVLVMGNVIRNNRGWSYASANAFWRTTSTNGPNYNGVGFFQGFSGSGLNQDRTTGITIYRNIFINNGYIGTSGKAKVYNNTIMGMGVTRNGILAGGKSSTFDNFTIRNNIIDDNYFGIVANPANMNNPKVDYNLYQRDSSIGVPPIPNSANPAGHLLLDSGLYPKEDYIYAKVCDANDRGESICYQTPWEVHGVENQGQKLFVDATNLDTSPIQSIKAKLSLASGSKAIDSGMEPSEVKTLMANMAQVLGITIVDQAKSGNAYDIGALEYGGAVPLTPTPTPPPGTPTPTPVPIPSWLKFLTNWFGNLIAGDLVNDEQINSLDWTTKVSREGGSSFTNYALRFDGVDGYVEVPHSTDYKPVNQITIEGWIKADSFSTNNNLTSTAFNQMRIWMMGNNSIGQGFSCYLNYVNTGNQRVSWYTGVETGRWYHLACVYDGQYQRLYVDGVKVGEITVGSDTINQDSNPLMIGRMSTEYTDGEIDEVRIWDVARSEAEIEGNMNREVDVNTSELVGYWRLNEGNETLAHDATGNHNDGQLTNGVEWVADRPF